jgi:hypothetical protein
MGYYYNCQVLTVAYACYARIIRERYSKEAADNCDAIFYTKKHIKKSLRRVALYGIKGKLMSWNGGDTRAYPKTLARLHYIYKKLQFVA